MTPVRWGFLGAGYVASRGMAPAVHAARGAVLHAVASREKDRSRTLEPAKVHASYEHLLDDPEIEVVYISLRNGQHREWVERSLAAGKHVVCEKPLALHAADARAMFIAAERNERLLVEAVWAQWHPRSVRMVDLAASGALGVIAGIESRFTFTSDDLDGNYRLDPTMGGGALLDVGCYQVHTWVAVAGETAAVDLTHVERLVGPTAVDLTTRVSAQIDNCITAALHCSFVEQAAQSLMIRGSVETIRTGRGEAFTTWREPSSLWVGDTEEHFEPVDAFVTMTEAVSARIRGEDTWVVPPAQSVRVSELLDAIRETAT